MIFQARISAAILVFIVQIDCQWGEWTEWSSCSLTCGGGVQLRSRVPSRQARNGGEECSGSSAEQQACNSDSCLGKSVSQVSAMLQVE